VSAAGDDKGTNMKAKELRARDPEALRKELGELLRAHFSLRMQIATQQLTNTSQLGKTRRDIARVRTVLNEKAAAK
jgi:large subunit ribosomal protein L29